MVAIDIMVAIHMVVVSVVMVMIIICRHGHQDRQENQDKLDRTNIKT